MAWVVSGLCRGACRWGIGSEKCLLVIIAITVFGVEVAAVRNSTSGLS